MKKITAATLFLCLAFSGFSQIALSSLNNKSTISGTEKIPCSGSGNPSLTPNLLSDWLLDEVTASTAGATITLDLNSQKQRIFVGSASFSTAKTIAFSNSTNALVFNFTFNVANVAGVVTFPTSVLMADVNFDGDDWTPPSTGVYEMGGTYDGTNWFVKIVGPFN